MALPNQREYALFVNNITTATMCYIYSYIIACVLWTVKYLHVFS